MGIYQIKITGYMYVKGDSKKDIKMKKVVEEAFEDCKELKLLHKKAQVIGDTTDGTAVVTPLSEISEEELEKSSKQIYGTEWKD